MAPLGGKFKGIVQCLVVVSACSLLFAAEGVSETGNSGWSSSLVQLPAAENRSQPPVITALALHPSGKLLALAGDDHVIHLWDLNSKEVVQQLRGHTDWIQALAYAPDGRLVSTGHDRRVLLWPAWEPLPRSGTARGDRGGVPLTPRQLTAASHVVSAIAFDGDGNKLAMLGFDDALRIIDAANGATLRQLECPCVDMRACAFSPRGTVLAAGGRNGKIRLWEPSTGRVLDESSAHRQRIRDLAFSPDGNYLASGSEDRSLRVANLVTGEEFFLPTGKAKVMALAFCGPQLLASGGSDNVIRLWNVEQREESATLTGHTGSISALEYGGQVLVSASFDATVRVWTCDENLAADRRVEERVGALPGPPLENYR